MELDSNHELIILDSSDNAIQENGDIMMLEELYRQEKFMESLQQFTEKELSKLDDSNTTQADIGLIRDFKNDCNFSSDKTFTSTLFQESTNYESTLHRDEDEFIDLVLENEDLMLIENQLFVDCGTLNYNGKPDYEESDEFQMCLATVDSSLDPLDDLKIKSEARVYLERLPESIKKVKDIAKVTTDQKIKFSDRQKSVQLYCHKCKKFEINNVKVSMPKNCQDCGDLLIYLCTKCKEKYFVTYSAMKLHRKVCKSTKTTTTVETPTSLFLYDCQDCDFRTLHKDSVDRHLRKTKHMNGHLRVDENEGVKLYTRQFEKDFSKAFKRFCKQCNEITSSTNILDGKLCKKCNTRLFYRCIKCHVTSKCYKSLIYHLKNKCLSKKYKCCKCNFVTTKWNLIRRHMNWHEHFIRIKCEYCNFDTNHKDILSKHLTEKHNLSDVFFHCKICNRYTTTVTDRLAKHILRRHSKKNNANETFACAICKRYSTNDQNDLWKHIVRRHAKK